MKGKVIIALNTAWNLYNFRAGLIKALIANGYEVVAVAPPDDYAPRLFALGCKYIPLPMDNRGTHPGKDFLLLCRFILLVWREKPDVYLGYTVKPNIYGSLAAHLLGVPVVNNIAGLGATFINRSRLTKLIIELYRVALSNSAKVFFQNQEDRDIFLDNHLVRPEVADILPGSGINLDMFKPSNKISGIEFSSHDIYSPTRKFRFLLVARMIRDKGIEEYVAAARSLKSAGYDYIEFCLLGFLDVQNPTAISRPQMGEWINEGVVNYLGDSDDVRPFMQAADCVVLPSYREGTSRTLLEAAAMSKPIVTTDVAGCREVVKDGYNGFLCKPRDPIDLAEKMKKMYELPATALQAMGQHGRAKAEAEFDEQIVINKYLNAINQLIP